MAADRRIDLKTEHPRSVTDAIVLHVRCRETSALSKRWEAFTDFSAVFDVPASVALQQYQQDGWWE